MTFKPPYGAEHVAYTAACPACGADTTWHAVRGARWGAIHELPTELHIDCPCEGEPST